jgi:hypothetical protein
MKQTLALLVLSVGITFYFLKCRTTTPVPISKVDTVIEYVHVRDTILKRSITKLPGEIDTLWKDSVIYIADTSYPKLKLQYEALLTKHFTKNIYIDSLPIGTYGSIIVKDTIQFNEFSGRSYISDYKIPIITKTITQSSPKENEFYIGGGLATNNSVQIGAMLKTKNDKLIGVFIGGAPNTKITYGVQYYVKLGKN